MSADSPVCVDACVAVKWVFLEADSFRAVAMLRLWEAEGRALVVPEFFWAEAGSAARKRRMRGEVRPETARAAYLELVAMPIETVPVPWQRAYDIAEALGDLHLYDACYLAVAESVEAEFWTADGPLVTRASSLFPWIHLL